MQKLAEVCIKRPVFATMLVMAFVVVGAASWFRLGVDRFPAVDLPTVNVRVELPGDRALRELTEVADKIVRPQLERSSGVGEVRIVGGLPRAVNVWVDPDRLAAYQIPITNVRDAVARQNADLPGGNVTAGLNEASLRTMGRIAEPRAFNDLVVATLDGVPVRARDIGYA